MSSSSGDAADFSLRLADERATRRLGALLSSVSVPGDVFLLDGPLGAGKTTLVQGFVEASGAGTAASPSFVLAHRYEGAKHPIWHIDLYRIEDERSIDDLDLDYYVRPDAVALIEWASRSPDRWPEDRVEVDLSIDGDGRMACVRGRGGRAAAVRRLGAESASAS